jgi:hypothetical protein
MESIGHDGISSTQDDQMTCRRCATDPVEPVDSDYANDLIEYRVAVGGITCAVEALNIQHDSICPIWNYTIRSQTPVPWSSQFRDLFFDAA